MRPLRARASPAPSPALEADPPPRRARSGQLSSAVATTSSAGVVDPDDQELPDASPLALKFASIPYLNFAQAFSFIQTNPSILVEQTTDSLLLEAFNAEIAGEKDRARRCVEKGLLVQYCRKLGKDGVRLFFQRCVRQPRRRALRRCTVPAHGKLTRPLFSRFPG